MPKRARRRDLHSLPVFVRLNGVPVILLGDGDAAAAKRRLLERAGAQIVGADASAVLAIVAIDDDELAEAAVARLKARGVLVNAVDRVALCDFTLPAIVDRDPVLIAIGTGGASAGLAKALRQRLEALLPSTLGEMAIAFGAARSALRTRFPDAADRRQAIDDALRPGGELDPFDPVTSVATWLAEAAVARADRTELMALTSSDPDDLTVKQARWLGQADRIFYQPDVPAAIIDRARADAVRIAGAAPVHAGPGLTISLCMAPA